MPWQAVWPVHRSTNHHFPISLLQLARAGRRAGSIFYGLRPLWVVHQARRDLRCITLFFSPYTEEAKPPAYITFGDILPLCTKCWTTQYVLYVFLSELHEFLRRSMQTLFCSYLQDIMNAIADCSDSEVDLLTCITDILGEFPRINESADSASQTLVISKVICWSAWPTKWSFEYRT
jgi:hypothetical protein